MYPNLINLSDIKSAKLCGGKFLGLAQVRNFVKKFSTDYNLDFRIPKTFGIPCHNIYLDDSKILSEIVQNANKALELCGGNVAVRSSANVEDAAGKTFSGCFRSVLNVKNSAELEDAIYKVLMSLSNPIVFKEYSPEKLSMGIVIQQMIDAPEKAGVVYSEGYMRQPYIPISYVENKLADKLVMGEERGKSFIEMKAEVQIGSHDAVRFLPNMINNKDYQLHYYDKGVKPLPADLANKNIDLLNIAGFASALEGRLGHAVDVEFAIKGGASYILQQRPYIMPEYKTKQFTEFCMSIYNPEQPIIKGEVLVLDDKYDMRESEIVILKQPDGFTYIQQNRYKFLSAAFSDSSYNHQGNFKRESNDKSCLMIFDNPIFPGDIQTGDYIELNLLTGELQKWYTSRIK